MNLPYMIVVEEQLKGGTIEQYMRQMPLTNNETNEILDKSHDCHNAINNVNNNQNKNC